MRPTLDSGAPAPEERTPGQADADGNIYWPGDEEAGRAPGSALVLLVLSFVAGGLYLWQFWPLMAGFDWIAALTLKSSVLAVLGGAILVLGGVLMIRHGLIWAIRLGAVIAAVPMTRLLIDSIADTGGQNLASAGLAFLLQAGPALIMLGLSFSPPLTRWRIRRQHYVAEEARTRRRPADRNAEPTSRGRSTQ